jgi:methylated-DNA-[protein]-cysteine S-methyltransferase
VTLAWTVVPAPGPIGALTVGVTGAGLALVAFGAAPETVERAAARLVEPHVADTAGTAGVAGELTEYLAGARTRFDVPLDWRLTAGSQRRVLEALYATVPFGGTVTYGELAGRAGLGGAHTAARGVGAIMGSNPLPVVVPCHRVLAADGLGGFGGGRRTKEWLLAHEGVLTPALDFWPE